MKVVIAGGKHESDYIIGLFKEEHHQVICINPDEESAEYISKSHGIPVMHADPTKSYSLEDSRAKNADVIIALSENDIDNYITCLIAKKHFGIKKTICRVQNPKRVEIFKRLGVDTVISSIHMLAHAIQNEANIEKVFKTLQMEDDRIALTEITVDKSHHMHDKRVMDLSIPNKCNIACIIREADVIIPNGRTVIKLDDKMIIISAKENVEDIEKMLKQEKHEEKLRGKKKR